VKTGPGRYTGPTARGGEATADRERSQQEPITKPKKAGSSQIQRGTQKKQRKPRDAPREASNRKTESPIGRRSKGNAKPQRGQRANNMRKVVLLTLVKDVVQVILDFSCAVEMWRAHETEKLDLSSAETYECTCHVYGQTHKYKQQLQATKQFNKEDETVHLSRLWTDTQVWIQKPNGPRKKRTCRTRRSHKIGPCRSKRGPSQPQPRGAKREKGTKKQKTKQ